VVQELTAGQVGGWSTAERNRLLLKLLLRVAAGYLRSLRQIDRDVDALEDKLHMSMKNKELLDLLKYQKSMVYFTTALRSNELMLERLQKSRPFRARPEDEDLLEDVLTENQQAIEMVNISNNILSQMMDAFASIISNNLNVVMKLLTSITIILMIPTWVSSFYGMNVTLPFQNWPYAFVLTLVLSVVLSLGVVAVFLKKQWF
jgi:magnesium transporter